jgi:phage shock protein C
MKRYRLSRDDRKIAGVCGGLGDYFGLDSTIIRLAFVLVGAITGFLPLIVGYAVAWLIVPKEPAPKVRVETGPPPRSEPAAG